MIESEITSTGGGVTIVIVAGEGVDTVGIDDYDEERRKNQKRGRGKV